MALLKVLITFGVGVLSILLYFLVIGYKKRSRINELRKQGVPMPEWSWWTGHLLSLKKHIDALPADANVYAAMQGFLPRNNSDKEIFLLDLWPMTNPSLMISSPEIAFQVSNKFNLQKPDNQEASMRPVIGGPSIITMNDDEWKLWRGIFNPGFSASHMLELVPMIVESVDVFCHLLREKTNRNDIFSLCQMTTRLTMEIITKTVLDTDLDNQLSEHALSLSLHTILNWHSFWDPRVLMHPLRPFVQWYHSRRMDLFIRKELEARFEAVKRARLSPSPQPQNRSKSIVTQALDQYVVQKSEESPGNISTITLDDRYTRLVMNQVRLFLFAGNDTTSATLAYVFDFLSKNPDVHTQLCEEHGKVFGPVANTAALLKERPALLNQCPLTLAVIKETLRLYPPASSLRHGRAGVSLTDRNGRSYSTAGLDVNLMHFYTHRNPLYWVRPHEFLPERWLVGPEHELHVPKSPGAYRPFEAGPRNCIGQTLVLNEMRIVLIMTVRTFEIRPAYKEDAIKVFGNRAYQTSRSGAFPAGGYPCRVTRAIS